MLLKLASSIVTLALASHAASALGVQSSGTVEVFQAAKIRSISLNRWGGPAGQLNVSKVFIEFSHGTTCELVASNAAGATTANVWIFNDKNVEVAASRAAQYGGRTEAVFFIGPQYKEISATNLIRITHAAVRSFNADSYYETQINARPLKIPVDSSAELSLQKFLRAINGVSGLNTLKDYCSVVYSQK